MRLLDRPLFGKREVWVKTAPSFEPNLSLYDGLRYRPSSPTELTRRQGHLLHDFIPAAKERGIRVYFQVQAAIPPGYRVQFGGRLIPTGRSCRMAPSHRVDSPRTGVWPARTSWPTNTL